MPDRRITISETAYERLLERRRPDETLSGTIRRLIDREALCRSAGTHPGLGYHFEAARAELEGDLER